MATSCPWFSWVCWMPEPLQSPMLLATGVIAAFVTWVLYRGLRAIMGGDD